MGKPLRGIYLLAVALLSFPASGCSKGYHFEVMGTVRSAVDGKPLSGVRIAVNTYGEKGRPDLDEVPTQTDDAGAFATEKFYVSITAFDPGRPPWYLKVEKEGYLPEFVEIRPKRAPQQTGSTSTIVSVVYLRPAR
jgi:hypothetical protein